MNFFSSVLVISIVFFFRKYNNLFEEDYMGFIKHRNLLITFLRNSRDIHKKNIGLDYYEKDYLSFGGWDDNILTEYVVKYMENVEDVELMEELSYSPILIQYSEPINFRQCILNHPNFLKKLLETKRFKNGFKYDYSFLLILFYPLIPTKSTEEVLELLMWYYSVDRKPLHKLLVYSRKRMKKLVYVWQHPEDMNLISGIS